MSNPVLNWRLLEREIIDIAEKEGLKVEKNINRDFILVNAKNYSINLSKLAQALADRGVMAQGATKALHE